MKLLIIGIGALALIVLGALFLSAPPAIIVAPEHIFDIGGLHVTNTMFTSWVVVILLCAVAFFAGRSMSIVPHGWSGAVEAIVTGFYGIVEGIAGPQNARRFFWVVATIFFYVWISNYFGLLPITAIGKPELGHGETQVAFKEASVGGLHIGYVPLKPASCEGDACPHHEAAEEDSHATTTATDKTASGKTGSDAAHAPTPATGKAATDTHAEESEAHAEEGAHYGILAPYFRSVMTDVNAPLAIALFSFIFVEYWGLSALGPGYLKKFFNFGALFRGKPTGLIDVFVGLLELISELSRTISFTFRLFGNVFAGEVLLIMITSLVPLVLIQVFYGLELLVGLIQAFVFAMLTLVFAQMAVAHHGGDEDHGEAHSEAH
jgi:F-type H+-transporting ATPase subunit a